jgi:hypothetical protein
MRAGRIPPDWYEACGLDRNSIKAHFSSAVSRRLSRDITLGSDMRCIRSGFVKRWAAVTGVLGRNSSVRVKMPH